MVLLQNVSKKTTTLFSKNHVKELPASLSQTKSNKNIIKNEFNFYPDMFQRHSFYPYETKKSKKIKIDWDDTVYSVYLGEIIFSCMVD